MMAKNTNWIELSVVPRTLHLAVPKSMVTKTLIASIHIHVQFVMEQRNMLTFILKCG